jgi:hypothetical protein
MKTYGGLVGSFIILDQGNNAGEYSVSLTSHFTPLTLENNPSWKGGWVNSKAGLDAV